MNLEAYLWRTTVYIATALFTQRLLRDVYAHSMTCPSALISLGCDKNRYQKGNRE